MSEVWNKLIFKNIKHFFKNTLLKIRHLPSSSLFLHQIFIQHLYGPGAVVRDEDTEVNFDACPCGAPDQWLKQTLNEK